MERSALYSPEAEDDYDDAREAINPKPHLTCRVCGKTIIVGA